MKLGFLGVGLMGKPMIERLVSLGYKVIAYNRTIEKLEPLKSLGVKITNSPAEVIKETNATILMLSDITAIKSLLFTKEAQAFIKNKTIIQMGTISPSQSQELMQTVTDLGGDYLESPVLGSIAEAKTGKLIVMVGSMPQQLMLWQEVLKAFTDKPLWIGEVGKAAALKLALNQLISSLTASFSLSLAYVKASGVDIDLFMEILRQSAIYAPTFDKKLNRFLEDNYSNPNFPVKHLEKDTHLFLEESSKLQINTIVLQSIHSLLLKAIERGDGDLDYSAIFRSLK